MGIMAVGKCMHCGYRAYVYFGLGWFFPMEYQEIIQKMKEGGYGDFSQNFFNEHPDGAIDCSRIALICRKCKKLCNDKNLTMYVPKEGYKLKQNERRWSVAFPFKGAVYATKGDLEKNYIEYAQYSHICPECASQMEVLSFEDVKNMFVNHKINCAKCDEKMDYDGMGRWD